MIFFFGNSSAKSTFKILAQNNSPADIVSARYFPFMESPVHRLKSCGSLKVCPQLLSLFLRQLDLRKTFADTMSAGGPQFQFRGHNRHRNRRVLHMGTSIKDPHKIPKKHELVREVASSRLSYSTGWYIHSCKTIYTLCTVHMWTFMYVCVYLDSNNNRTRVAVHKVFNMCCCLHCCRRWN